jgi:hypothetical protein
MKVCVVVTHIHILTENKSCEKRQFINSRGSYINRTHGKICQSSNMNFKKLPLSEKFSGAENKE